MNTLEDLLAQMTLEEKVSLAAGSDFWHTTAVPRLGIGRIKVSDGPNGARGAEWDGISSACFPCGTALAATWNPDLVKKVGRALADEVHSKGAQALLAPTVNIHRSPLGGRNFECYSEDPWLSARMAVAYITGLQEKGVAATIKHFVGNDSEFERNSISSEIGERALREIYLLPFEAAVKEAGVWAIMTAYNRLGGIFAAEHPLLAALLREEWGFDGLLMSDWFGTKSTVASAKAGLDLEMPGPAVFMGQKLLGAVRSGEVAEKTVEDKARQVLRLAQRTGALGQAVEPEEQSLDLPPHREVARQAATEAIVLLKNEGALLPLRAAGLKTLAIIGPNAEATTLQGGGSAGVIPHYAVNFLDGIRVAFKGSTEVVYERGCSIEKVAPALDSKLLSGSGLRLEYFAGEFRGDPLHLETLQRGRKMWMSLPAGLDPAAFSVRGQGQIIPRESGLHRLALSSVGRSRLYLEGQLLIDNWSDWKPGSSFFGLGSDEKIAEVGLEAGKSYAITLEFASGAGPFGAFLLGASEPVPADLMERAVALASRADAAVVVVGTNADWETEGVDRANMDLPGRQTEMIRRVAAANPRTVVVVNAGSPVEMGWAEGVPAVLVSWFAGQEAGNALADVLVGQVSPAGRLPTTFPQRLEDNPAFINYPGENGRVVYGEGLFVGYRYYDKKRLGVAFPFGHGLSYTTFAYDNLRLSTASLPPGGSLEVALEVSNTGPEAAQEVVQLYIRDPQARLARPEKELKGFAKVFLQPGQKTTVSLGLDMRSLAYYDDAKAAWVADAGQFEVLLGASSQDIRARASFQLEQDWVQTVRGES